MMKSRTITNLKLFKFILIIVLTLTVIGGYFQRGYWIDRFRITFYVQLLKFDDQDLRRKSAIALGKIGPPAIPSLVEALKSKSRNLRFGAAWALSEMGKNAQDAIPALCDSLHDEYPKVRICAVEALSNFGQNQHSPLIVQSLTEQLQNPDTPDEVIYSVVEAVGTIGIPAKETIPLLCDRLKSGDWFLRMSIAESLSKVGAKRNEVELFLIPLLSDESPNVRQAATRTIGILRIYPALVVDSLVRLLNDGDIGVKTSAATTLLNLEPDGTVREEALVHLDKWLKDPDPKVRRQAVEALGDMSNGTPMVVVSLGNALNDSSSSVRIQGAIELAKIFPHHAGKTKAISILNEELGVKTFPDHSTEEWSPEFQSKMIEALGRFGPESRLALPKLQVLVSHDDRRLRFAAQQAIDRINNPQ